MNGQDCLLTFAELSDSQIAAASDTETIRRSFLRQKKRRIKIIGTTCSCLIVVLMAVGFGTRNLFQPPAVVLTQTENSDNKISEPLSSEVFATMPGVLPPETEPTASTSENSSNPKRDRQTTAAPTETRNQQETGTKAPQTDVPSTTKVKDTPTTKKDEAVFYLRYTYCIVDSAFSAYRPGKVVGEEMVGDRLENASATGVYIYSDGRTEEDETLRCEIFALTGVDPGIAVCVRFIDKGKGLTTDHYYLLYNPTADTSTIEAYLIPQTEPNNEE